MARRPKPWFWKARQAWFVTIDGTRHFLGREKEAAVARFHQLMARPRQRFVRSESLAAVVDAFLEWTQRHRSPDTYEWYRFRLQRFVEAYPDASVTEIRPLHVQQWVDGYTLSSTSRRNYFRSVKRCMKWAVQQGYLDHNPVAHLEMPAAEHREILVSEDEYQTLLSLTGDESFRDLVEVTWETGCRPQESLRVEGRHVDVRNQRWVFPRSESKNKRFFRVVYLTDHAFEITMRQLRKHPQGPLFRNTAGRPWTTDAVNCAFRRARVRFGKQLMRERSLTVDEREVDKLAKTLNPKKGGGSNTRKKRKSELLQEARKKLTDQMACRLAPKWSLYALRHSWATHALQRGLDPLTVAILMGHQDPSMLARVYQHLSLNPQHLLDQARKAAG